MPDMVAAVFVIAIKTPAYLAPISRWLMPYPDCRHPLAINAKDMKNTAKAV